LLLPTGTFAKSAPFSKTAAFSKSPPFPATIVTASHSFAGTAAFTKGAGLPPKASSDTTVGTVVGISLGLLALAAAGILWFVIKRRREETSPESEEAPTELVECAEVTFEATFDAAEYLNPVSGDSDGATPFETVDVGEAFTQ
jgi:hypothetical protein